MMTSNNVPTKLLIIFSLIIVISHGCWTSKRPRKPHIVFIVADDLGYYDIGYHGARFQTENLDRLAAEGVKLENYYGAPTCSPSRSMLMTGKLQIHTGVHLPVPDSSPAGLSPHLPTIGDIFKLADYDTAFFGKWHLGFYKKLFFPQERGFDRFFGIVGGGADHYTYEKCDFRYVNNFPMRTQDCGYALYDNFRPAVDRNGTYSTSLLLEKSIEMIKDTEASDKSMFLLLSLMTPKRPLKVPEEFLEPFQHIENESRRTIAGMIYAIDKAVGSVVDALKESNMWEDTILVFSSDNGGIGSGNNFPLRGRKATRWEGGIRVPGFISGPRVPEKMRGKVFNGLMDMTDWLPTLAEAAEIDICPELLKLDGVSQWSALTGREDAQTKNEVLHALNIEDVAEGTPLYNDTFDTRMGAAIRIGDYKLITGNPGDGKIFIPPETNITYETWMESPTGIAGKNVWLFNIKNDPSERYDLSSKRSDQVLLMLDRLRELSENNVDLMMQESDPASFPRYHGGVWGPWRK